MIDTRIGGAEAEALLAAYRKADCDARAASDAKAEAAAALKALVGDGNRAEFPDGTKVAVSPAGTSRRVDAKMLAELYPEASEACSKEVATSPRLTVTWAKGAM